MVDRGPRYFPDKYARQPLFGIHPVPTPDRVLADLKYGTGDVARLNMTALAGKWVEEGLLRVMTGAPGLTTYDWFPEAYYAMQKRLGFLGERTYTNNELLEKYYAVIRPMHATKMIHNRDGTVSKKTIIFCGADSCANQIIEVVDATYGFKLMKLYQALGIGSFPNPEHEEYWENLPDIKPSNLKNEVAMRRYIFESALILFRQLIDKEKVDFPDKLVFPDVKLPGIQFDGIMVDRDQAFGIGQWVGKKSLPGPMVDLPWDVIEVKTKFSPRFVSGKNTLRKPLTGDVRQFRGRLGELMLRWSAAGYDFRLPRSVYFVYPRAVLPHRIFKVDVDHQFLSVWKNGLSDFILASDGDEPESRKLHSLLTKQLK